MFNNQIIAGSSGQGGGGFYSETIDNSVRIVGNSTGSNAGRFTRTFSTVDSATDFTLNFWVKRNEPKNPVNSSYGQNIFNFRSGTSGSVLNDIAFAGNTYTSGDQILITDTNSANPILATSNRLRDFSAWYNIHIMADMNNATASERLKIFINGTEASYAVDNRSSYSTFAGLAAGAWTIGDYYNYSYSIGSTIARWAFVDNSTLAASNFGEFSNDIWVPKALTGITWGSAGHLLDFAGTGTSQDSSGIGADTSGRNNHWAVSNIAASDCLPDAPTLNYCTMHTLPSDYLSQISFTEGNLKCQNSTVHKSTWATFPITSGKWYWEALSGGGNKFTIGLSDVKNTNYKQDGGTNFIVGYTPSSGYAYGDAVGQYAGTIRKNGSTVASSLGYATNDKMGIAFDADAGKVWFHRNGTWHNGSATNSTTLDPSNHDTTVTVGETYTPVFSLETPTTWIVNFGQDSTFAGTNSAGGNADENGYGDFFYAVPSGFLALNSENLPQVEIGPNSDTQATDHFDVKLWSADVANPAAGDKQISLDFRPDLVWSKNRNNAENHYWMDSVRGDNVGNKWLRANSTAAEGADAVGSTTAKYDFTSTGFDIIDTNSGSGEVYYNSRTYVGWCWKAGGATPTQTYTVKVVSDSGNKYRFDDFGTSAVTLELQEGGTYTFDQSDSSNSGHPLRFSTTSNGTHGGGTEYTTGVTTYGTPGSAGAKTTITVASGAPTLYYYCSVHSGMGGQANTNSTFGSSNFKGSLQNVVSANKEAGFSIVTWTAPNDNGTLGHGLDSAPELIIAKPLGSGTNWYVMHTPGGVVPANNVLNLDNTSAAFNPGVNHFNDTYPTSTVFSYGGYLGDDLSNDDKVAYCYHSVEGYSKVGSYVGNASTSGTFVYTGFRPAWVMVKCSSSSQGGNADWRINDSQRLGYNPDSREIYANLALAEASGNPIDIVSNGFKIRNSSSGYNGSGATYIYLAFAEAPFKYANAR